MKKNNVLFIIILSATLSCTQKKEEISIADDTNQTDNKASYGSIEILDDEANFIIEKNSEIAVIDTGFTWTEGPLWLEKEEKLLFSDVPNNIVYEWSKGRKKAEEYLKPSGYTGKAPLTGEVGSNALAIINDQYLLLCQHGDRQIAQMNSTLDEPKSKFISIASEYEGKRFNSPNDLKIDNKNNIYFTDPHYGLEDRSLSETKFNGVYNVNFNTKNVKLLIDSLSAPNGIGFSPDYKKLYVANSDTNKPYIYVYNINNDALEDGKIAFDFSSEEGVPDGFFIDEKGYIFSSGPNGIWILNPQHKLIARINLPEKTSNCTLDSKNRVLYITNTSKVVSVNLKK